MRTFQGIATEPSVAILSCTFLQFISHHAIVLCLQLLKDNTQLLTRFHVSPCSLTNSLPWFQHVPFPRHSMLLSFLYCQRFFFENGNIMTSPVLTFFMDMFVTSVTQTSRNNIPGVIQCDEEEKSLCWNFSGYLRVQEESRKEESQEADDKV